MSETPAGTRRLAAVMFLDMVGYSALMSKSEARALGCVHELETLLRSTVAEAGGRLVKFLGDGTMAEFPTAGAAVACSRSVLARIAERNAGRPPAERLEVRIGLHLGELVEENGDIFGDAVNIAARVQPLADPGGIAMTGTVHAQVKNQGELSGVFLPPTKLKNIPERMKIFLVPPVGSRRTLWALRKRGVPAAGLAGLLALLAAGGWLAWRYANQDLNRFGILYVRTAGEGAEREFARELQDKIDLRGASFAKGVQWVNREGILDLFSQEGISDPEQIEKLEVKSCSAARRGGLGYTLAARLEKLSGGKWKLTAKVICTRTRTVVGAIETEGSDSETLASGLLAQLQGFVDQYLAVD